MGTFTGLVTDLDFIANLNWCQVILRSDSGQLIAITREHRMQTLLELAFSTRKYAEVAYDDTQQPYVLSRVKVNVEYPPDHR